MYSWSSWRTLVPLIGGVIVLFGWVIYSYSGIVSSPMIPLVVLNDRTAAISYFGNLVHGLAVRMISRRGTRPRLMNFPAIRSLVLSAVILSSSTRLLAHNIWPCSFASMSSIRTFHSNHWSSHRKNASHQTFQFHRLAPFRIRANRIKPSQLYNNGLRLDHAQHPLWNGPRDSLRKFIPLDSGLSRKPRKLLSRRKD